MGAGEGGEFAGVSRLGNGARSYGLCTPFPLFCCHACEKWQFGGLSGDARESRVEVVEGEFPRKRARVHNNFKSKDLLLKRKVGCLCKAAMLGFYCKHLWEYREHISLL